MNSTEQAINKKVDAKITQLASKEQELTSSVNSKITEMNNTKQTLTSEVSAKISEVNTTVEKSLKNINDNLSTNTKKVDVKIQGYDTKVSEVDGLIRDVNSSETARNQAEQSRTSKFNEIINELEITQSDIDEIISMVGGL